MSTATADKVHLVLFDYLQPHFLHSPSHTTSSYLVSSRTISRHLISTHIIWYQLIWYQLISSHLILFYHTYYIHLSVHELPISLHITSFHLSNLVFPILAIMSRFTFYFSLLFFPFSPFTSYFYVILLFCTFYFQWSVDERLSTADSEQIIRRCGVLSVAPPPAGKNTG